MVLEPIHCPDCDGIEVIKHGTTGAGKQRYRCQNRECSRSSFIREYSYQGYLPDVKRQISGHVLDKGSSTLDNPSKLIPIDKQSQHDIMHLNRFGKANRLACQSLDSGS
jgi:transposase-like protein